MNREKVIDLAREAGFNVGTAPQIERFAALIEAEVCEKNARLCGSIAPAKREFDERFYDACYVCADVIRSGQ